MELNTPGMPDTEYSEQFLQGMLNRMAVSYHKYGEVSKGYPRPMDAVASLIQRLEKYKETGNTEFLMDAANFAMIEFMCPAHPDAHFTPTDSDQSPGRTTVGGQVTDRRNEGSVLEALKNRKNRE